MNAYLDPVDPTPELQKAEAYRLRKATSVLAIVFTDTANSTAIRESLGDVRYETIRESFDEAVAAIIEEGDDGVVVKSTGDGCLAVFAEPSTAVERCLRIQRELGEHEHIRLRIGVDMGQVSVKSSRGIVRDVFGRHVNRAARIEALAEPGQVLVSFHVFDCAVGWLRHLDIEWRSVGLFTLKGFSEPIAVYEPVEGRPGAPIDDAGYVLADSSNIKGVQESANLYATGRDTSFDDVPMFSLGQVRELTDSEWSDAFIELRELQLSADDSVQWDGVDPISSLKRTLTRTLSALNRLMPEPPAVLWVDDYPENNETERRLLEDARCHVDIATDSDGAVRAMRTKRYLLVISDMGRGDDATAGITLLRARRELGLVSPVFIYASPNAVAAHREVALGEGAILCTAGLVSLLDGVSKLLSGIQERLSEVSERQDSDPPAEPVNERGWLSRLWRRFHK